ncbi:MAG: hypothetical protein IIC20_08795 [Chloroflexi bacterium]|nr:hypothetical protein [Chloroflexota bacterium]
MLFVATHRHSAESCPSDNPVNVHELIRPEHAAECGVKVLGGYVAPPEHLIFHVLEADDYASIVKFYRPIMTMGDAEITPVQTLEEAAGIFPVGDP